MDSGEAVVPKTSDRPLLSQNGFDVLYSESSPYMDDGDELLLGDLGIGHVTEEDFSFFDEPASKDRPVLRKLADSGLLIERNSFHPMDDKISGQTSPNGKPMADSFNGLLDQAGSSVDSVSKSAPPDGSPGGKGNQPRSPTESEDVFLTSPNYLPLSIHLSDGMRSKYHYEPNRKSIGSEDTLPYSDELVLLENSSVPSVVRTQEECLPGTNGSVANCLLQEDVPHIAESVVPKDVGFVAVSMDVDCPEPDVAQAGVVANGAQYLLNLHLSGTENRSSHAPAFESTSSLAFDMPKWTASEVDYLLTVWVDQLASAYPAGIYDTSLYSSVRRRYGMGQFTLSYFCLV